MKISALNPFVYDAKTEKGNTYKKSYAWTAGLVGVAAVTETLPYLIKKPIARAVAKSFSIGQIMPGIIERFAKMPLSPKLHTAAIAYGVIINLGMEFLTGRGLDKVVNRKRAQKADKMAEQTQKA